MVVRENVRVVKVAVRIAVPMHAVMVVDKDVREVVVRLVLMIV